jgi:hypothetical protein
VSMSDGIPRKWLFWAETNLAPLGCENSVRESGMTNFLALHLQTRNRILETMRVCTIDWSVEFEESDVAI